MTATPKIDVSGVNKDDDAESQKKLNWPVGNWHARKKQSFSYI